MSYILAIEPDPAQASALRRALREVTNEKITVVSSKETALGAIDRQTPDLVLLHALMPPGDDEHLIAYLCTLPETRHVQVIRIPRLHAAADPKATSRFFGRLKKSRVAIIGAPCDPRLFAEDVAGYLARARVLKTEIADRNDDELASVDRRRDFRWTPPEVPWVSSVQLAAGEQADLVDISLSGALVRTPHRPRLLSIRSGGHDAWARPGLTLHLASGQIVQVTGEVVRCRPAASGGGTSYQVAFRFDESADMYLPTVLQPGSDDPWTRAMAADRVIQQSVVIRQEALNQWCQW